MGLTQLPARVYGTEG